MLDHTFFYSGPLGNTLSDKGKKVSVCVWAPTAQQVELLLWDEPRGGDAQVCSMTQGPQGEWSYEV